MIKKLTIILVSLISSICSFSQDFNQYKTLAPQGKVPKDFTELSAAKAQQELSSLQEKQKNVRRTKQNFIQQSTFRVDDFLTGGTVMFGDDVTQYVSQVLEEVLKQDPALLKQLRVYTVKSTAVNAFTTNNGIVFVNLGLLARLENEAQLAFTLAHEAVHFQKKHVINSYVRTVEINQARGDYRKLSTPERGYAKSSYSKELETEADQLGADIYLKTAYAKDSVHRLFDVLETAPAPLVLNPFDATYFESKQFQLPDTLVNLTSRNVKTAQAYISVAQMLLGGQQETTKDDTLSSHPSVAKRKKSIARKFSEQHGGRDFIVGKDRFYTIRKIARFEVCRMLLLEHRFTEALALALSLRKEDPKSAYIQACIAKALYGIARKKLEGNPVVHISDWQAQDWGTPMFARILTGYELSVLAMRELNKCYEAYPESEELPLMLKDLTYQFAKRFDDAREDFRRTANAKTLEGLEHPYTQHAFLDFRDNAAFFKLFDDAYTKAKAKEEPANSKRKKQPKHIALNVNKVVVVTPMYVVADQRERKKEKINLAAGEEVLININDKILEAASELGMKADVINPNKVSSSQVAMMQSNSLVNDWIDEQSRSDEEGMISPIYNEINALAKQHQTEHFMWMGGISVRQPKRLRFLAVMSTIWVPPLLPLTAGYLAAPRGKSLYFAVAFNVKTQKVELVDVRAMQMRGTSYLLQSNIYYTLFNLKH